MKCAVISNASPHGPLLHRTHLVLSSDHYRLPVPHVLDEVRDVLSQWFSLSVPTYFSSCCRAFSGHPSEFLLDETKLEDAFLENP